MNIKDKVVLVTGGAGFIGSHLCDAIIQELPEKLIIFDNLSASDGSNIETLLEFDNVEFVKGDIRDYDLVERLVERSDIVFNLACSNVGNSVDNPRIDLETNIIGTFNVLQAARNKFIKIIHVSSGSVQNQENTPYSISKMAGENYCKFFAKNWGVNVSVLRYFHVYGPRQDFAGKSGVINIFLNRILNGLPPIVWGDGSQMKCFTYVKDVIEATLLVAKAEDTSGEVFEIASDERINIVSLANILIDRYSPNENMVIEYSKGKIGENANLLPDTSNIEVLGWHPSTEFNYGLSKTVEWLKEKINK